MSGKILFGFLSVIALTLAVNAGELDLPLLSTGTIEQYDNTLVNPKWEDRATNTIKTGYEASTWPVTEKRVRRGYAFFDTSQIPQNAEISRVRLVCKVLNPRRAGNATRIKPIEMTEFTFAMLSGFAKFNQLYDTDGARRDRDWYHDDLANKESLDEVEVSFDLNSSVTEVFKYQYRSGSFGLAFFEADQALTNSTRSFYGLGQSGLPALKVYYVLPDESVEGSAPRLTSPCGDSNVGTWVTFEWDFDDQTGNNIQYDILAGYDPSFDNYELYGTSFSKQFSWGHFVNGRTVFWRVGVLNSKGDFIWSDTCQFTIEKDGSIDNSPPVIAITSPSSAFTSTSSSVFTVKGTAQDLEGNGVSYVVVNNTWANNYSATGSETANWNLPVTLSEGSNLIRVRAADLKNNSVTKSVTINYTPRDTRAPIISLTEPGQSTFNCPSVDLKGTIQDPQGQGFQYIRIFEDGEWYDARGDPSDPKTSATFQLDDTVWLWNNQGDNRVTIRARNKAGYTTDREINLRLERTVWNLSVSLFNTGNSTVTPISREVKACGYYEFTAKPAIDEQVDKWRFKVGTNTYENIQTGGNSYLLNRDDYTGILEVHFKKKDFTDPQRLEVAADAHYDREDNRGYGFDTEVKLGEGSSSDYVFYLKFDIDQFYYPESMLIDEAHMHLYCHNGFSDPTRVHVNPLVENWSESSVDGDHSVRADYNRRLGEIRVEEAHRWYEWDIAPLFKEWLSGATANNGLRVQDLGADGYAYFRSREYHDPARRPFLNITLTPDTVAPSLTIDGFSTNGITVTRAGTIQLKGQVSDNRIVKGLKVIHTGDQGLIENNAIHISGGRFNHTITLVDGSNSIVVEATDGAGNLKRYAFTVIRDTGLPSLSITEPTEFSDYHTNSRNLSLQASVRDPFSGINRVTYSTNWGPSGNCSKGSGDTYNVNLTLPDAQSRTAYTVTLEAIDNAENERKSTLTIHYDPPDNFPPELSLENPKVVAMPGNGNHVRGQLTGIIRASDLSGIGYVEWYLDRAPNGNPTGRWPSGLFLTMDAKRDLSIPLVLNNLSEGNHTLYVRARDDHGNLNTGSEVLTHRFSYQGPDHPPSITVDQVGHTTGVWGVITANNSFGFSGSASDDRSLSELQYRRNGGGWRNLRNLSETQQFWSQSVSLIPGKNSFDFRAVDSGGNTSTVKSKIVTYDTAAPNITLGAASIKTRASVIKLSGVVTDDLTPPTQTITSLTWRNNATNTSGNLAVRNAAGNWEAGNIALEEGDNAIIISATDTAGRTTSVSHTIRRDSTNPNLTINSYPGFTRDGSITLTGSVTDANGIDNFMVNGFTVSRSGNTWSYPVDLEENTINRFAFEATDSFGNSRQQTATIVHDADSPSVEIDWANPNDGQKIYSRSSSITLGGAFSDRNFERTEAVSNRSGGLSVSRSGNRFSLSPVPLHHGDNMITVTVIDKAGNRGSASRIVYYDPVPALSINRPEADGFLTNQSSIQLDVNAVDSYGKLAKIEWKNPRNGNGGQQSLDQSSYGYQTPAVGLLEGNNDLWVRVWDDSHNLLGNNRKVTRRVILDSQLPSLTIQQPNDGKRHYTNQSQVTLSGQSSDPNKIGRIDLSCRDESTVTHTEQLSGNETNISWSFSDVPLSVGLNTVEITAHDKAGNQRTLKQEIIRDVEVPSLTVSIPAVGGNGDYKPTHEDRILIQGTWSDNHGASELSWVNNKGGFGTGTVQGDQWSAEVTGMSVGKNDITIILRDWAGNSVSTPVRVEYDDAPPELSIDLGDREQPVYTNRASIDLDGGFLETVGLASLVWENDRSPGLQDCRIEGTRFFAEGISLEEGRNLITFNAVDTANNTSQVNVVVIRDITPPSITLVEPSTGPGHLTDNPVQGLAGEYADNYGIRSIEWKLGGEEPVFIDDFADGRWDIPGQTLEIGENMFAVTATDFAGNSATSILTIVYDPPPNISIVTPTRGGFFATRDPGISLSGQATDNHSVDRIDLVVNGTGPATAVLSSSRWEVTGIALSEGLNVITVTATDNSGFSSARSLEVLRDNDGPVVSVTEPATSNEFHSADVMVAIGGTIEDALPDPVLTVESDRGFSGLAVVDGGTWHLSGGLPLDSGENQITILAADELGNETVLEYKVILDQTAPQLNISHYDTAAVNYLRVPIIRINGTAADNFAFESLSWSNNRGGNGEVAVVDEEWAINEYELAGGVNDLAIIATDRAGNSQPLTLSIVYDITEPIVEVIAPRAEGTIYLNSPTVLPRARVTDAHGIGAVTWSGNGQTGRCFPQLGTWQPAEPIPLPGGASEIAIQATDRAGNETTVRLNVFVDTQPPEIAILLPVSGKTQTNSRSISLSGTVADNVGIGSIQWADASGSRGWIDHAGADWQSTPISLQPGVNVITLTATDLAGNEARDRRTLIHTPDGIPVDYRFGLALDGTVEETVEVGLLSIGGGAPERLPATVQVAGNEVLLETIGHVGEFTWNRQRYAFDRFDPQLPATAVLDEPFSFHLRYESTAVLHLVAFDPPGVPADLVRAHWLERGSVLELSAPFSVEEGRNYYEFVRWRKSGAPLDDGERNVTLDGDEGPQDFVAVYTAADKPSFLAITNPKLEYTAVQGRDPHAPGLLILRNAGDLPLYWEGSFTIGSGKLAPSSGIVARSSTVDLLIEPETTALPEGASSLQITFTNSANHGNQAMVELAIDITNQSPLASGVYLEPTQPLSGDTLVANYAYIDPDGHIEGSSRFRWFRNGEFLIETNTAELAGAAYRNETWHVEVIPHDGFKYGATAESAPVLVANQPPTLTVDSVPELRETEFFEVNLTEWTVDNDNAAADLTYAILTNSEPLNGASLDNHILRINPAEGYFGTSTLSFEVSDSDGATAESSLRILVNGRPVVAEEPEALYTIEEDSRLRFDLWQFFSDPESPDSDLEFAYSVDREEVDLSLEYGRYLVVSGNAGWPLTVDGVQDALISVSVIDPLDQQREWSPPTMRFLPVNDPPRWLAPLNTIAMTDGNTFPLVRNADEESHFRLMVEDEDSDLSTVAIGDLFRVETGTDGLLYTWEDDQLLLQPQPGWFGQAVVRVTVNDNETRAEPLSASSQATFTLVFRDDDTQGPSILDVQPIITSNTGLQVVASGDEDTAYRVPEDRPFNIQCRITDSQSGIYDESDAGGDSQGVALIWDTDGNLFNGDESVLPMSEAPGDLGIYITDTPVPAQDGAVNDRFVYRIIAWDNDFDLEYPDDRARTRTPVRKDIIINDLPEVDLALFDGQQSDDVPLRVLNIHDANGDPLEFYVEFFSPLTGLWEPADLGGADAHSLGKGWQGPYSEYDDTVVTWRSRGPDAGSGDLPGVDNGFLHVRIRAFDGFHTGPWYNESGNDFAFHLDNDRLPTVTLIPLFEDGLSQPRGDEDLPGFAYQLRDEERSHEHPLALRFEYRWNPEGEWQRATCYVVENETPLTLADSTLTGILYDPDDPNTFQGIIYWDVIADAENDAVFPVTPAMMRGVEFRAIPYDEYVYVAGHAPEVGLPFAIDPFSVDPFPRPRLLLPDTASDREGFLAGIFQPVAGDDQSSLNFDYRVDPGYLSYDGVNGNAWYVINERIIRAGSTVDDLPAALSPIGPRVDMAYGYSLEADGLPAMDGPPPFNLHPETAGFAPDIAGARGYRIYENQTFGADVYFGYANQRVFSESWNYQVAADEAEFHDHPLPNAIVHGARLLIRPSTHKNGAWYESQPLTLDNNRAPRITGLTRNDERNLIVNAEDPALRGNIHLRLSATDAENDVYGIEFAYSLDDGTTVNRATVANANAWQSVTGDPEQVDVVWLSAFDLQGLSAESVRFGARGIDDSPGPWHWSDAFDVENSNQSPSLAVDPLDGPEYSGSIPITFKASDDNGDHVRTIAWQYSTDEGGTWTAIPDGHISGNYPREGGGGLTVNWNSHATLPDQQQTVQLRFALLDSTDIDTSAVALDHADPGSGDGVLWDRENHRLWTFDYANSRAYPRDPLTGARNGTPVGLPSGKSIPLDADASSGPTDFSAPSESKKGPVFSLPGLEFTFLQSGWNGASFGTNVTSLLVDDNDPFDGSGIALADQANSLWFTVPTTGTAYRYLFSNSAFAYNFDPPAESFTLEGTGESVIAFNDFDAGTGDPLAGLWTLDRDNGSIRQYAWDNTAQTYLMVRFWPTGRTGLRSLSIRNDRFWLLDKTNNQLFHMDGMPVSRFVRTDRFIVNNTGLAASLTAPSGTLSIPASTENPINLQNLTFAPAVTQTRIRWFRQPAGTWLWEEVPGHEGAFTLPSSATRAGEHWQALLQAADANGWGGDFWTNIIFIPNTAPRIGTLAATPVLAFPGDALVVEGWPEDPDQTLTDSDVTYSWQRKANVSASPETITSFANSPSIPGWSTKVGEVWTCTVSAIDRFGEVSEFPFNWTIGNQLPHFTQIGNLPANPGNPMVIEVEEGEWVYFRLEANDPDRPFELRIEDVLEFVLRDPRDADPGGLIPAGWNQDLFGYFDDRTPRIPFTFDPVAHTFFWWPDFGKANNELAPDGRYAFTFSMLDYGPDGLPGGGDDGDGVVTQEVIVQVTDRARAPYLYPLPDITVEEGDTIMLTPDILDLDNPDGTSYNYALTGWRETEWDTGTLTITTTYEDAGLHEVTLAAIDVSGQSSGLRRVRIRVRDVNRAPVVAPVDPITIAEGEELVLPFSAADPDGDSLRYSFRWLPAEATLEDHNDGTATFSWTPPYNWAGDYELEFPVRDDRSLAQETTLTVSITVTNTPVDTDSDSMDDDWEREHFGSLDRDGSGDVDSDGFIDAEEAAAGSDPNDSDDIPARITRRYSLNPGWNTVVLDIRPEDRTLGALLVPILDQIEQVRGWDAASQSWWRWDRLHPELSHGLPDDLADWESLPVGLRVPINVKVGAACSFEVEGHTTFALPELHAGWNRISIPSYRPITAAELQRVLDPESATVEDLPETNLQPREALWITK